MKSNKKEIILITKFSGKPFKCGDKIVSAYSTSQLNEYSNKLAYYILKDETLVDCYQCYIVDENGEYIYMNEYIDYVKTNGNISMKQFNKLFLNL